MRASRLLSILILLQLRGRLSAEQLAREFEVSVRTIYRDMDQLSAAGVPVYAERGRDGGFALLDGYRTRLTGLSPTEADALSLAGASIAAADLGLGSELASAQLKLMASLPPDKGASADRVARRFHLDPVSWYRRTETLDALPVLAEAVWRDRQVRIEYDSWAERVSRTLDPLGLVLKGGAWYLVAAVDGKPRTYRVSNIRRLEPLDEPATRPPRFDLPDWWAGWTRDFESRLLRERARIRVSPEGLNLLRAVSAAAAETVEADGAMDPQGWRMADIPIESVEDATRQLLHLGAEVEVLSPPALRNAVGAVAERVAALYR